MMIKHVGRGSNLRTKLNRRKNEGPSCNLIEGNGIDDEAK